MPEFTDRKLWQFCSTLLASMTSLVHACPRSQTSIHFNVINDCMINVIQINLTILHMVYPCRFFDILALNGLHGSCNRLNSIRVYALIHNPSEFRCGIAKFMQDWRYKVTFWLSWRKCVWRIPMVETPRKELQVQCCVQCVKTHSSSDKRSLDVGIW